MKLACDMTKDCQAPVRRIDREGWLYCENHGQQRGRYIPCRRLTATECTTLETGGVIPWAK